MSKKLTLRDYLANEGVPTELIDEIAQFRNDNPVPEEFKDRVKPPVSLYFGGKALTQCIVAFLEGKHILLEGDKATGKNVLADTIRFIFGRPGWTTSCHNEVNKSTLLGSDTFKDNEVTFRKGHVVNAMEAGGVFIGDEINFSRPEAVSVLYSVADGRGEADVEEYQLVKAHPAFRIIGTMNYGYAGTRELNEALADRFVVIHLDSMTQDDLTKYLAAKFKDADTEYLKYFAKTFCDLQRKAQNSEISSKSVSLRGIQDSLSMIKRGLKPAWALEMGIINKSFDAYERDKVKDTVFATIDENWNKEDIFPPAGDSRITVDFGEVK